MSSSAARALPDAAWRWHALASVRGLSVQPPTHTPQARRHHHYTTRTRTAPFLHPFLPPGVLTKVDIMDRGTDAVAVLKNETVPLALGFVGVVLRRSAGTPWLARCSASHGTGCCCSRWRCTLLRAPHRARGPLARPLTACYGHAGEPSCWAAELSPTRPRRPCPPRPAARRTLPTGAAWRTLALRSAPSSSRTPSTWRCPRRWHGTPGRAAPRLRGGPGQPGCRVVVPC